MPNLVKYVIMMILCAGVNFVPTFLIKGRIDSAIFEVDLPTRVASRKRMYQGVHPPAETKQVTKSHSYKVF